MRENVNSKKMIGVVGFLVAAITLGVWLISAPIVNWKSQAIDFYSSAPYSAVRLGVRSAVGTGNFEAALDLLKKQQRLSQMLGGTSFMKQDLIDHSMYVFRRARLVGEEHIFSGWLRELAEDSPDNLVALIGDLLASGNVDGQSRVASERLLRDFPIDVDLYRSLINSSETLSATESERLCQLYHSGTEGRYDHWFFPEKFPNQKGFSAPVILVTGNKGLQTYRAANDTHALSAENFFYNFQAYEEIGELRLFLPWPAGTKSSIRSLEFQTPHGRQKIPLQQLEISSMNGFLLGDGVYLVATEIGDALRIRTKAGLFPSASSIVINMTLSRLAIHPSCVKN